MSIQDLVKADVEDRRLVNVETGEVLDLATADSGDVAAALFAIRTLEAQLREAKNLAGQELLKRMDREASWTLHAGAFDVKGSSPAPQREADIIPLIEELHALVDEEHITDEAALAAIERVIIHKVRWGPLNAIRKLSPEIRERIDKHIREVEKKRSIPSVQMRAS